MADQLETTQMDPKSLPKIVRRLYINIQETLGHPAEVKQTAEGWAVIVASDRVRVTFDFTRSRTGKTVPSDSTLSVDGKSRALAQSWNELRAIFDHPEGRTTLRPMPDPVDASRAPAKVRKTYDQFASKIGGLATVVLGFVDNRWVLAVENETTEVRVYWHWHAEKRHFHQEMALVKDGEDRTAEVMGDIQNLLAALTPGAPPPEAPQNQGTTARGTRSNSVETRRATVIRN